MVLELPSICLHLVNLRGSARVNPSFRRMLKLVSKIGNRPFCTVRVRFGYDMHHESRPALQLSSVPISSRESYQLEVPVRAKPDWEAVDGFAHLTVRFAVEQRMLRRRVRSRCVLSLAVLHTPYCRPQLQTNGHSRLSAIQRGSDWHFAACLCCC